MITHRGRRMIGSPVEATRIAAVMGGRRLYGTHQTRIRE